MRSATKTLIRTCAVAAAVAAFVGLTPTASQAYGSLTPIPNSTQACTANATSYAQVALSYAKTWNTTGCNNVSVRMRYNNGTVSPWVNGGSGTATVSSASNTSVGGGHRRCDTCGIHNT